jgi:hypothetical protein
MIRRMTTIRTADNIKVLIACETSGTVRDAFYWEGFDAWSCDILPSDTPTNRHMQLDVREALKADQWDLLVVAHPPCTRLCNSGVRWLHKAPPNRTLASMWQELDEGCELFSECLNASVPLIAVENPVMHRHAKERIRGFYPHTQSVQPWEFAESIDSEDNQKKRTCLWLKNLPKLTRTGTLTAATARDDIHKAPPSADRWKIRSKFHTGIAQAMADQWGAAALQHLNSQKAA